MPIRYKRDLTTNTVKAVECEKPSYPHTDADGDTIYENSHFKTEAEAWKVLEENAAAWVRSTAQDLERTRKHEAQLTRDLADRALALTQVQERRQAFMQGVKP